MDHSSGQKAAKFLAHLDGDREQLLRDHLLGVSLAARRHSDKIGLGPAGAMIGLLHDLGKYSNAFQQYLRRVSLSEDTETPDSERGKIDHSTAGAQTIWQNLKPRGPMERVAGEILAICVASHHSGLIDCIAPSGLDNLSRRMHKLDAESHFEEASTSAEPEITETRKEQLDAPNLIGALRAMIAKICQTDRNETIRRFKIGLLTRFLFSCLIDADRTDTADFSNRAAASLRQHGRYTEWRALAGLLEHKLKGFSDASANRQTPQAGL